MSVADHEDARRVRMRVRSFRTRQPWSGLMNGNRRNHTTVGKRGERLALEPLVGDRILDLDNDEARPPAFTDEGLALRFAEQHAGGLRYVDVWGRWLTWDTRRWQYDDTLGAYDLVRQTCRTASAECNRENIALGLASAKTVAAVERLARSDRRLAATADQWDSDPWLLNTPEGIIDLRSGRKFSHRADAYMTKITAVTPNEAHPTPVWEAFLQQVTGGDVELVGFLRRMTGYALTGSTQAHSLFFMHGAGANGKSTFINAITGSVGDYHRAAPIEAFIASTQERHPTDLAGLRGARLVTAVETDEGRRWNESKIKALTGGDKIAARFMRQDFFEFMPQFKLLFAGNHKPGLQSVDEAIRRRFHLIPFTVTIPPEERDETLAERLRIEWPGILAWAIAGCLEWQEHGLAPPEAVTAATGSYFEGEDAISAWIEERCERRSDTWVSSSDLFRSWKDWSDKAGEPVGTMKRFVQCLENRRFRPRRQATARGFDGLALLPPGGTGR
jgi:putative DNA primase/helicase